jgi:cell shape-determining protein MreC
MNYRLDKKYKKRNAALILIAVLVFVFFMFRENKFSSLSNLLQRSVVPIWKTEVAFTDVFLKEVFTSKKDLIRQNEILKSKLEESKIELMQSSLLKEENESLKEIFLRSVGDENIIGTILSKPNHSPYGTIVIDIGEEDGVKPEDLVFAMGNVVIGEIESVNKNSSNVILYSAPGYISQVTLENTGRYFNAKGRGAGDFEIQFPRELEIEEGQIFLYPSINNYVVGVVEKVMFDPRDSYKTVLFRSAVNIQELKWVQVRISK